MTRIALVVTVAALTLAIPAFGAEKTGAPGQCLELINAPSLNTSAITQGLGLTGDQVKEIRARLSQYNSIRGFSGFDGLGLTADQIATMKARIAAQVAAHTHPLGWPCPAFKHRAKTVAFVRALLVGNGFAPFSVKFYGSAPRQIQVSGTLDGVHYDGAVARSGVRQITLQLVTPDNPWITQIFATPFDA